MQFFFKSLLVFILLTRLSFSTDHQGISEKKPRVSIITSVFKGDEYMELFLSNIVKQTIFNECELILINAASPGNEEPIIEPYLKKYPNISYERLEKDPGVYGVWNLAIKKAKADYITNANIDDQRDPVGIEAHAKALDEDPTVDLVYCNYWITYKPYETYEVNSANLYCNSREFSREIMLYCIPGPAPMWRKSMHEKAGYFSEQFFSSGDFEMWNRAVSKGSKFKKIPGTYTLYYENPNGLSTRPDSKVNKENKFIAGAYRYLWNGNENQPPKLLIKISSQSNPEGLFNALNQYYRKLSGSVAYHFLISLDENDPTMNTPSMREKLETYPNLSYFFGPWTSPVLVHNRDIEKYPNFDILFMANDATISITDGYDRIITEIMSNSFPSYDGVLMVKTGTETEENMLSVVGKKYYERFGYVYYPGYHSGYYDAEFIAVGELLHRVKEAAGISLTTKGASENQNRRLGEDFELFSQRETNNYHVQPEWFSEEVIQTPKEETMPTSKEEIIPAYRIPLYS